jgi:hypothetical protein
MLAAMIVVALVIFDVPFLLRMWRASRIKQKRALRMVYREVR